MNILEKNEQFIKKYQADATSASAFFMLLSGIV